MLYRQVQPCPVQDWLTENYHLQIPLLAKQGCEAGRVYEPRIFDVP